MAITGFSPPFGTITGHTAPRWSRIGLAQPYYYGIESFCQWVIYRQVGRLHEGGFPGMAGQAQWGAWGQSVDVMAPAFFDTFRTYADTVSAENQGKKIEI